MDRSALRFVSDGSVGAENGGVFLFVPVGWDVGESGYMLVSQEPTIEYCSFLEVWKSSESSIRMMMMMMVMMMMMMMMMIENNKI